MKYPTPLVRSTPRGLRCSRGGFYVDPMEPADVAVLTHAHSDHARFGSRIYHAAEGSELILGRRLRSPDESAPAHELIIHPYGERFPLGDAMVSFHPAGHILGSAQVRIECDGEVWVVSGDYKRAIDPTCRPFEVVACDVFITEATFGLPIYRWESGEAIAREVFAWWEKNRERGRVSLLGCYSLGKAQRLLAELRAFTDRTVFVHGAVENLVECYRNTGVAMLPTQRIVETTQKPVGELVLAPPSAVGSAWSRKLGTSETAFASGWMRIRGNRRRKGFDRGFSLSDHADWPSLVRTIEETGAKKVLVTHGYGDPLVRYLNEKGTEAELLSTSYEGEGDI